MSLAITPSELGLPPKFVSWRPHQAVAINQILDSERRFVEISMPVGGGKTLCYIAGALLAGLRVAVLTSTKGLQDQLLRDFQSVGLTDIRGRQNYQCRSHPGLTCEDGMHAGCREKVNCPYRSAYSEALSSQLVVTNYPYWMLVHKYSEGLGRFDVLVLDEAHDAADEVCNVMAVELYSREIYGMLNWHFLKDGCSMEDWRRWAIHLFMKADESLKQIQGHIQAIRDSGEDAPPPDIIRDVQRWKSLASKLQTLGTSSGPWEYEPTSHGFRFDPLWPSAYTHQLLFFSIPKVVLVSATLTPKTSELLGIPEDDADYKEYPYMFPPHRSPVIYVPTVKVDHKWDTDDEILWSARIDRIISLRLDRKGIVHTVSYKRRDLILNRTFFPEVMITHDSKDAVDQATGFKTLPPPAVLLTPSMSTGYDFPYSECEYQIICKVPFPDSRSRIMTARQNDDALYGPHLMAQTLTQTCGRGMRAANDQCENIVIDDNIRWVMKRYRDLFPTWFRRLYRRSDVIPDPPPPLRIS